MVRGDVVEAWHSAAAFEVGRRHAVARNIFNTVLRTLTVSSVWRSGPPRDPTPARRGNSNWPHVDLRFVAPAALRPRSCAGGFTH